MLTRDIGDHKSVGMWFTRVAMDAALPQNLAEAHALIERLTASLAEKDAAPSHRDDEIERLERILDKYIRRQYGKSSEQLPPEQMALGLEDLETGIAAAKAKAESQDATRGHGVKRGDLPIVCRASKSSSSPRPGSVPAAAEHCMSSVRTNPSASTLFLPSIVSSSPVGPNMAAGRVASALARPPAVFLFGRRRHYHCAYSGLASLPGQQCP